MNRRTVSTLLPHICRACQARIASSAPSGKTVPKRHISKTSARPSVANSENKPVERRIQNLGGREKIQEFYGNVQEFKDEPILPADVFARRYRRKQSGQATPPPGLAQSLTVYGRVISKRGNGKKLAFVQISTGGVNISEGTSTQLIINYAVLREHGSQVNEDSVGEFFRRVQRGDWIAARGTPVESGLGEWSIRATNFPQFLAPALQTVPLDIADEEFRMHNRHADQIVHPPARDVIFIRHRLLKELRSFLNLNNFIEVTTPLLQADAGGAVARPFETTATEFSRLKLNLRVAPELFLKRLIVGGMQKVYELGPAFRNEGVDATHNPEFTICEFYGVMMKLPELMSLTEKLFQHLAYTAKEAKEDGLSSLRSVDLNFYKPPFKTLEFIPALGDAIREELPSWKFPVLEDDGAFEHLVDTFRDLTVALPANPTIPRLLDALAGRFLEPQCQSPTFITHQPECMGPLARSFEQTFPSEQEDRPYRVSARAELFIKGREYVNCYEEENSPIEQRRKFEEQLKHRHEADDPETHGVIDENYLRALEWGMPPTGGWGCGFDRIVMLFSGKKRIADVLPFGTLRNVVGLGSTPTKVTMRKVSRTEKVKWGEEDDEEVSLDKEVMASLDRLVDAEVQDEDAEEEDAWTTKRSNPDLERLAFIEKTSIEDLDRLQRVSDEAKLPRARRETAPRRLLSFKDLMDGGGDKS